MKRILLIAYILMFGTWCKGQQLLAYHSPAGKGEPSVPGESLEDERTRYIQQFAQRYRNHFNSFSSPTRSLIKYIEMRLVESGLPVHLKSIAYIESAYNKEALSHAGARGLWQLMPGTASDLRLVVNDRVDERIDVVKSTDAAIAYLKYLYRTYDDWMLAIAAYNCGPGGVNNAIARCGGARDITTLERVLPAETRDYVRRFEAATIAWTGTDLRGVPALLPAPDGGKRPDMIQNVNEEKERKLNAKGYASCMVNAGYRLDVISEMLGITSQKLEQLNKNFYTEVNKSGTTSLILPKEKMTDFKMQTGSILAQSLQRSSAELEQ